MGHAGSLIWLPVALVAVDWTDLIESIVAALLVTGGVALLLTLGVGLRKLVRRSAHWRALEERSRQPPGPLTVRASIAIGMVLAALLWATDALTGSPLVVLLVGAIALMAVSESSLSAW